MTSLAEAVNVTLQVTWPGTVSANQGSGVVHIWLLATLTVSGSSPALRLGGTTQTCGTTLPPISLDAAGQIVSGGNSVQITLPAGVWDAPSMPKYVIAGGATGWDASSSIHFDPVVAPVGLAMAMSPVPWPRSSWGFPSGTQFTDADGDGKPGITAVPLDQGGFVLPPTGLGLFGSAPTTDKIYIVSQNQLSLSGTRTSCTDAAGTADVTEFDNHVVGCHVKGGSDCTTGAPNTQADFVDQSRTVYAVSSATFVGKQLAAGATCADVLSALP